MRDYLVQDESYGYMIVCVFCVYFVCILCVCVCILCVFCVCVRFRVYNLFIFNDMWVYLYPCFSSSLIVFLHLFLLSALVLVSSDLPLTMY